MPNEAVGCNPSSLGIQLFTAVLPSTPGKFRNFACRKESKISVMPKVFQVALFGLMLCAAPALIAQRSTIQFHGTPASVTSPRVDGTFRGIPASVTDPTFRQSTIVRPFTHGVCCRHGHNRSFAPVYAVPYYGYYGYPSYYDTSFYDQPQQPVQQQAPPPQVIIIKDERSSANDDRRYGEHEFEEGESTARPARDEVAQAKPVPAPVTPAEELPLTTLVYRDGHKSGVRNYAIVGGNLIDLTKSSLLKKIPLASLDLEATRHENEENGVDFHLP